MRALALLFAAIAATILPLRAETDKEVEAHKAVLDLVGAFTNEGFKIRDGHWSGTQMRMRATAISSQVGVIVGHVSRPLGHFSSVNRIP